MQMLAIACTIFSTFSSIMPERKSHIQPDLGAADLLWIFLVDICIKLQLGRVGGFGLETLIEQSLHRHLSFLYA